MFSSDQSSLKESEWLQANVINALKQKHLLALAINDLCVQIQQTGLHRLNDIGLKIEHDAVNHIESLIIDVFISILISSPSLVNLSNSNSVVIPPEVAYSEAMSSHSSTNMSASTTISSLNSIDSAASVCSAASASPSSNLYRSYVNAASNDFLPILDIAEAKARVLQVLPHNYAETALSKALSIVDRCRTFMNSKKRVNKLLKAFGEIQNISSNYRTNQTNTANNELAQIFKFPIDKIFTILSKRNFDIFVTIFLVYILEFITKDILRLATVYVRCLGKHSISQIDVKTAIQADHALTKIFYSKSASTEDIFDMRDDYDDDDELDILFKELLETNKKELILTCNNNNNNNNNNSESSRSCASNSRLTQQTTTNSNEECISDSSTICPETVSIEKLITKYNLKVKELRTEQKQYVTDLNVLRRVFMYLFRKCSLQFQIAQNTDELIDNIFGNINDLYDCSLRLADLLDESNVINFNTKSASSSPSSQQLNLVGQHFWELAEGDEFSVYLNYALNVTNYTQVSSGIKLIINNPNVNAYLHQTSPGLAEISKYLLPKLLIGSIYHFLYLYETIECLQQISTDELDKTLLSDTLDTLKTTKFKLKDLGFIESRRKPIETSFRMFHLQQLQQLNETAGLFMDTASASASMTSSMSTCSSVSSSYSGAHVQQALVSNIYSLTKSKLIEIEKNVESFKLSTNQNKSQSAVIQILSNLNNSINSGSTNNLNANTSTEVSVKNAYLYEGYIATCKTNQSFQAYSGNIVSKVINQQKLKVSKRYAYLFDGILILVKKHFNNLLTTSNSKYTSRFKQALSLDKCILRDLDDDCCFELELCISNSSLSTSSSSNANNMTSSSSSSNQPRSNQEFIIFMTDSSKDKYQWMSMLCYSQYKFTIDRLLQQMTEEQNEKNPLPIPPDNYIFDHPDSPETVLYEQPNHHYHHQTRYLTSDTPTIKAATLVKLIERSTHYLISDQKFLQTFLMCYREFCTPNQLLDLLIQRYNVPDLTNLSQSILAKYANDGIIERELIIRYKLEYQQPIRLKVINFIKKWINGYYLDDFANDADLLRRLQDFIEKIGQTNQHYQQQANILQKQIDSFCQRKLKLPTSSLNQPDTSSLKSASNTDLSVNSKESMSDYSDEYPPFETHLEKETGLYDLFTIHPLEFARQATLMEFEIFKEVRSSELISAGWNKADRNVLAPNLAKLIELSNDFIYWYAKCIVETYNLDERVAVMQRILEIAHYFHEMNNFSGLKQIYSAFEISSVRRLQISRDKVAIEENKMYNVFKKLFENHEKKYLESIRKCNPPCLPFLGSFLTAIVRTKEYNKVNDEKLKKQILKEQQEQKEAVTNSTNNSVKSNSISLEDTTSDNINATFSKSNLINFSKYRLVVGLVVDLLQYQNISYKFRVHDKIRSFILKEFEETYQSGEKYFTSDMLENDFETKLRSSVSDVLPSSSDSNKSSEFLMSRPDRTRMVEEWLFLKSKQIENHNEAFDFPKVRRHAFFKVQPPQSINHQQSKSVSQYKIHNKMKLNRPSLNSSLITSDINNNTNKSPSIPRIELKKIKSMPQQASNSINLFTAPYLISNLHPNINDIVRNTETTINSNYASSVGRIAANVLSSSHASIGSYVRSSSSFQKQSRSSHKRSNSSVQISKQNKDKLEQPIIEQLKANTLQSNSKEKTTNKPQAIKTNSDFMNSSSHSIGISNTSTLSLTSSASALSSSSMFPSTTASSSNIQIPFGSIYAVSTSSSSPSPPVSLLQQPNNSAEREELRHHPAKPCLSSSSMSSAVLNEKLSLSSADSSSSAPNSPPPNYDEVFDSSSTTATFNFSSTLNTTTYSSSSSSNHNCFDNKTYFQRYCTPHQQHSSSLSNLKYLPEPLAKNEQLNQPINSKLDQPIKSALLSPTLSESSSSSSSSLAFSHSDNPFFKSKSKQFSVFSFPDFAEQNEEVELLKKKTSSRTSSIDILTPPPFNVPLKMGANYHMEKKTQTFSILTPPPSTPPLPPQASSSLLAPPLPPPPLLPPQVPPLPLAHLNRSSLSPSESQTSINSTSNIPAPPQYPPPAPPHICLNENTLAASTPPPIPARPKKK